MMQDTSEFEQPTETGADETGPAESTEIYPTEATVEVDTDSSFDEDEMDESYPRSILGTIWETAKIILLAMLLAFFVRNFVTQPFLIPSESMLNTLQVGDRVLVEKCGHYLGEKWHRGDILVFKSNNGNPPVLVKRLIAVGGDAVDLRDGKLYLNGEQSKEGYVLGETLPLSDEVKFPLKIPEGQLLMLGDNRENSADGREFGTIRTSQVIGPVYLRYWPFGAFGGVR